jgi:hypothetical protein
LNETAAISLHAAVKSQESTSLSKIEQGSTAIGRG